MNYGKEKDPLRQWQGKVSRAKGQAFEERLDTACEYYTDKGFANIEKTPEPMRVIKPYGDRRFGQFIAVYTKKAQPDYKGTLKGGRSIMFEAKYTDSDRITKDRVSKEQTDYMDSQHALGARCYVIIGYKSGEAYRIPWDVWQRMKEIYGRKYLKETDVQQYKIKSAWNAVLMILE